MLIPPAINALNKTFVMLSCRREPCRIMVHCRMLESTAQAQQESLGALGVNLIHAAFTEPDPLKIVSVS